MTHSPELDETDPTPPEYDSFKQWFYSQHPEGDALQYQRLYRAFQAGYRERAEMEREADGDLEAC
jgi:hypothetical protein